MRAVNLLPAQNRGSRQAQILPGFSKQSWIACSAGVGVVALGGVLLATVLASSTVSSRQKALQRLDQQIASLPKPKAVAGADTLAMRQSTISNLASQRMTWDDVRLLV